jgi:hypothetical protein
MTVRACIASIALFCATAAGACNPRVPSPALRTHPAVPSTHALDDANSCAHRTSPVNQTQSGVVTAASAVDHSMLLAIVLSSR